MGNKKTSDFWIFFWKKGPKNMTKTNKDWVRGGPFDRSILGFCWRHGNHRGL
jgi:hypothetical protein